MAVMATAFPPTSSPHPLSDVLATEIQREFPTFRIVPKRDHWHQRAIHLVLMALTFGGQRSYMTRYHTVLFGKLFVPDSWGAMDDISRVVLLRHERVHLRQARRLGYVVMALLYLFPIFPIGLAYGRARIEWEAYEETIAATLELRGPLALSELRDELVRRFTGPDYGWMWPFPKTIHRWFDQAEKAALDRAAGS